MTPPVYFGRDYCDRCEVPDLPLWRVPAPEKGRGELRLCKPCLRAHEDAKAAKTPAFDLSDVKDGA